MSTGKPITRSKSRSSLNTLEMIPEMMRIGISAVKIEGRQRSPVYVEQVTKVWRSAIDSAMKNAESYAVATRLDEPAEQACRGSASHPGRLSPSLEMN